MREIQHDVARWLQAGHSLALAQVVRTWGSSPRATGATMAVSATMEMSGSVSGGCIEGNVVRTALECLERGRGFLEEYHVSMTRAHDVGLSCGGDIDILISMLDPSLFDCERMQIENKGEYTRISIVCAPNKDSVGKYFLLMPHGSGCPNLLLLPDDPSQGLAPPKKGFQEEELDEKSMTSLAHKVLEKQETEKSGIVEHEGFQAFYTRIVPPPELVCIGGVHIAIHLTKMAKMLGYKTTLIDPRGLFTGGERFDFVDELIEAWPQEAFKTRTLSSSSALCALTHDPKIDVPALSAALNSPAFYIGSLGRSTTQLSRYQELKELGFSDASIARISGPIGLDLGGKEPAEIALSIMSEITMVHYKKSFTPKTMLESALSVMQTSSSL